MWRLFKKVAVLGRGWGMTKCRNCGHRVCDEKVQKVLIGKFVWMHEDEYGHCSVNCFECMCDEPVPVLLPKKIKGCE